MRILARTYGVILAAMCWPQDACAAERFIPDCAGQVAIAHARVARVDQDGALVLADGRILILEGVRLPPPGFREQALTALRAMVASGPVNFTITAPEKDRYDRLRVQGFGQEWLQLSLLEHGLARVMIAPDRNECAPDLYEAESRARARQAGIWALADYRVRTPQTLQGAAGSFQLVEGKVGSVSRTDGRTFIFFDRKFAAVIEPQDRRAFRDFDFDELSARRIRLRGMVQDDHGRLRIMLSSPSQIELLDN